jgi:hypothetical protein
VSWLAEAPTLSMSTVRKHFCTAVARGQGAWFSPVKYGLNGTMPAIVNSTEGSLGTRLADGTTWWARSAKNPRNDERSWLASINRPSRVCAPSNLGIESAPGSGTDRRA